MNLKSSKQESIFNTSNDPVHHNMQKFNKCNAYTEIYKEEKIK